MIRSSRTLWRVPRKPKNGSWYIFLLRAGNCCYVRQYLQTQFTLELRPSTKSQLNRQWSVFSYSPLRNDCFRSIVFFLFNLFFFLFVFFLVFSTPQRITHLTGFYFVCVFPCYLLCRRQMGTKSRQRKVIFEFSCFFYARLPAESIFPFFSSTCMSACWHDRDFSLSGI